MRFSNYLTHLTDGDIHEVIDKMGADEIAMVCTHRNVDSKYFELAIERGLFKHKSPNQILIISAGVGSLQYVKHALKLGANVNVKDYNFYISPDFVVSPLQEATEKSYFDIIKFLVENGADIKNSFPGEEIHTRKGNLLINSDPELLKNPVAYESLCNFAFQTIQDHIKNQ